MNAWQWLRAGWCTRKVGALGSRIAHYTNWWIFHYTILQHGFSIWLYANSMWFYSKKHHKLKFKICYIYGLPSTSIFNLQHIRAHIHVSNAEISSHPLICNHQCLIFHSRQTYSCTIREVCCCSNMYWLNLLWSVALNQAVSLQSAQNSI